MYSPGNWPVVCLIKKHVFPTAPSPTITTFTLLHQILEKREISHTVGSAAMSAKTVSDSKKSLHVSMSSEVINAQGKDFYLKACANSGDEFQQLFDLINAAYNPADEFFVYSFLLSFTRKSLLYFFVASHFFFCSPFFFPTPYFVFREGMKRIPRIFLLSYLSEHWLFSFSIFFFLFYFLFFFFLVPFFSN